MLSWAVQCDYKYSLHIAQKKNDYWDKILFFPWPSCKAGGRGQRATFVQETQGTTKSWRGFVYKTEARRPWRKNGEWRWSRKSKKWKPSSGWKYWQIDGSLNSHTAKKADQWQTESCQPTSNERDTTKFKATIDKPKAQTKSWGNLK